MTLERRLAKVDETLSPTQLVLRWMAEAHAFGDIEPYVASLLAEDPPVAPLDRLAREAVHGARTAMRGKRPELVEPAVRNCARPPAPPASFAAGGPARCTHRRRRGVLLRRWQTPS
jgi:hypothetical protein